MAHTHWHKDGPWTRASFWTTITVNTARVSSCDTLVTKTARVREHGCPKSARVHATGVHR